MEKNVYVTVLFYVLSLVAMVFSGCAHDTPHPSTPSAAAGASGPITIDDASLSAAKDYVTISYANGQYLLTSNTKIQIRNFIDTERVNGSLYRVEVAVWSDHTFPADGTSLSKRNRTLAKNRVNAIREFLKGPLAVSGVKTFNMAETSNALQKLFNTDQAELKSAFSKEGSAPVTREDFEIIQREGGPSKAVIVVSQKPEMAY